MTVATADRPTQRPIIETASDGLNVLIVDEHADPAEGLARVLAAAGHAVRVVNDGTAATSAAAIDPPDVLLLDIGLPGADGWEVARRVRAAPGGRACFVIAISGQDSADERRRSRDAGVDLHLAKPFGAAALASMLDGYRLP
jgi:CheY-like chemotaxis protein